MGDLRVAHHEHVAEDGVQRAAVLPGGAHIAFGHDESFLRYMRVTCIEGCPVNASPSICLSNSLFPFVWNAPGMSHSTSSVRHDRISAWSVLVNASIYSEQSIY